MSGKETAGGGLERRNFLKAVGLGTAAAAAVAQVVGQSAEADEPPKETRAQEIKSRYRVTGEVKNFYDLNRL